MNNAASDEPKAPIPAGLRTYALPVLILLLEVAGLVSMGFAWLRARTIPNLDASSPAKIALVARAANLPRRARLPPKPQPDRALRNLERHKLIGLGEAYGAA